MNVALEDLPARLKTLLADQDTLHDQLSQISATGSLSAEDLLQQSELIAGVRVIVAETAGANPGLMRQWIDQLRKNPKEPVAVLLASSDGDKVTLIAGLSQSLIEKKLSAGKWIGPVAEAVGGGGGGKPDLAQAGGKNPEKLPEAIAVAKKLIREMVGG